MTSLGLRFLPVKVNSNSLASPPSYSSDEKTDGGRGHSLEERFITVSRAAPRAAPIPGSFDMDVSDNEQHRDIVLFVIQCKHLLSNLAESEVLGSRMEVQGDGLSVKGASRIGIVTKRRNGACSMRYRYLVATSHLPRY